MIAMKNALALLLSALLLGTLIVVNVQLATAQTYTCTIIGPCGAGELLSGGIDSGYSCATGACWWNDCSQQAMGQGCFANGYSRQCSTIGPMGCPGTACYESGWGCSDSSQCCYPLVCQRE